MALFGKDIDSAFQGAGVKPGLEIWCIDNLRLVPVPKSSHGKFYSGSTYIVLNTILLKNSVPQHDIHYWLGKDAKEVDSALASDKALELDAALGSRAVQYREVQGLESEKFLSYFRPCIIPIDGVFSSKLGDLNEETYQIRLLTCRGDHVVHVKEVPFSRSSLNHNDVFILDTASKLFLFSGCNSSTQERAKALEVVQYIKENKHGRNCEVAIIEDGKLVGDSDVGEFWSLFGGYAPIPRDSPSTTSMEPNLCSPSVKLYWINTKGKLCESGTNPLNKDILSIDKCYMLDCDTEIFVWMGRTTSITERKTSISATEDFLNSNGRSTGTHLTFLTEGTETAAFRSYFDNWPQKVEPKLYEEGREKVAAIFKQHGYDVKELPPQEDYQSIIDCSGAPKVWRVNADELSPIPDPEQTKFFSGDCYILQYAYPGNGRDEILLYAWFGCESIMEDRVDAISHMITLVGSKKGQPVLAQVIEGKEPLQFFSILKTLIVYKGGLSKRYKEYIEEKGIADETYDGKKTALFRVQGTSANNMQAIQVDHVSSSLNSSYCYILQTEASFFTWIGSLSSTRDHDLLDRMLDVIGPAWQPMSVREGNEPDAFWNALGGVAEHPREKLFNGYTEDPNLFTCAIIENDLKVKEIFDFTQDDLTTEDVLVLNCHNEIHVWVGRHSKVTSKQQALSLGLKFLEADVLHEGLSVETPIYIVAEGHEPPFFTHFFNWDPLKANMHGNSFERKLAILKGKPPKLDAPSRYSLKGHSRETTPDGLRSSSVGFNGLAKSAPPASTIRSSDNRQISSQTPVVRKLFSESSPNNEEPKSPSGNGSNLQVDKSETDAHLLIHPYERLKVVSTDPATGIDITKREAYLSDEEFQEKFGMTKNAFYKLPKWRQNKLKISLHLF